MSLYKHHDLLGYTLTPGWRGPGSANSVHTIGADGLRYSGERPASSEGAILAVGDSFTYGDEVNDEETWPAQLQRLTGRLVLNGGVTGYGFDQIVLRAEQLVALFRPSTVIASFIADDIQRMEMSRVWWRDKPWFAIEGDELVLKGVPVPNRTPILPVHIRGRVDQVLIRWPQYLQHLVGYHWRVHRRGHGLVLAQRLIERLAALRHSARIVVMAQYAMNDFADFSIDKVRRSATQSVLACASRHGLATLDTFQRLYAEPRRREFYGSVHLNARGNAVAGAALATFLRPLVPAR